MNWEYLGRKKFVAHFEVLDRRSSIPDTDPTIPFLTHVQNRSTNPQSHTRPIWNEVSVHKAEVSAVDKASLKTLPTSYEYAVYIILLFKLDRSYASWSHVNEWECWEGRLGTVKY